jgi:hypothetical protein
MKVFLLVISTAVLAAGVYEPAISYFHQTRSLTVTAPDKQNYAVLDADVFEHARPDLGDLRILDGQSQVPFVLTRERGGTGTQETEAKILNLGSVGDRTEFDLDTNGFAEFDHVRLQLDAKDFVNNAQIEGRRTLKDASGPKLGTGTLYDFSKENLGSNFTLRFPSASFSYLHVRLAPGIRVDQVKRAYLSSFAETKAVWINAGQCTAGASQSRRSLYQCSIFAGMPVERITFHVPRATVNFNRTVVLTDAGGNEFQRGSISRVRVNRGGQSVTSEDLDIDVYGQSTKQITATIENGDDPALPIEVVQPLSVERRLYFDPKGKSSLQLYYGDPKLEAPSYDYGKIFQQAADAVVAQLGPAQANPQFTGRPDDRPWSERHGYVLWIAMVLAVIVLGGLALMGLKGPASVPR